MFTDMAQLLKWLQDNCAECIHSRPYEASTNMMCDIERYLCTSQQWRSVPVCMWERMGRGGRCREFDRMPDGV
jgi:hypothetical protein